MPNGALCCRWFHSRESKSESATRRLFIPSNAYVYCITMKLLLCAPCTTIMLGGARSLARVDYDEGDGGIKRRREQAASQPSLTDAGTERNTQIWQQPPTHLNSRHTFFSPLYLSRLIRAPGFPRLECVQLNKSGAAEIPVSWDFKFQMLCLVWTALIIF